MIKSGQNIPADCVIIELKDLFVNEATLTGGAYPVEKSPKILPKETPLRKRTNSLFGHIYCKRNCKSISNKYRH